MQDVMTNTGAEHPPAPVSFPAKTVAVIVRWPCAFRTALKAAHRRVSLALMKTCPTCQHTYPDDFSLCPRDGAHLTAPATETEAQLAGQLFRRFRLARRLGKGGMGTVFLRERGEL
jgi:hypothetical protein